MSSLKPEANANWNFEGQEAKLLALGVHDQDTSDLDAIILSRHSRKNEIMNRLDLGSKDVVLDLGSGMGFIAEVIAPEVGHVHCCDISTEFLSDCKRRLAEHTNISYYKISYADLSNATGKKINKGYATLLFIHFNFYDIVYYLEELNRVLEKGGKFYFDYLDGERYNRHDKNDSFQEHIAIYKQARESWVFGCMHMTSLGILKNLVPQAGFKIVENWQSDISFSQMLIEKVDNI